MYEMLVLTLDFDEDVYNEQNINRLNNIYALIKKYGDFKLFFQNREKT